MKMLDFNAIQAPSWPLKLKDEHQTVVHLSAVDVALYDRLVALAPELDKVSKKKDGRAIRAVFNLIAEIMNFNEDGMTFTAEELRDTYHMTLVDAFRFVAGYMEFAAEIQNAKN